MNTSIWIRVGDAGDYESFDSLDDAIDYLNALRVSKVTHWHTFGFATSNYHGNNYISIYHGYTAENPTGKLTAAEMSTLEARLVAYFGKLTAAEMSVLEARLTENFG